eukprot:scaffold14.g1235.t1
MTPPLEQQLLDAARAGNAEAVQRLLEAGADPSYQDEAAEGLSPLMAAAERGSHECVALLLAAGAPWQAQDFGGYTAGEYASGGSHRTVLQQLLNWAVRAELLLGTISRRQRQAGAPSAGATAAVAAAAVEGEEQKPALVNADYLASSLRYEGAALVDAEGEGVMMGWEAPLMERHAEIKGDVLNVGFGMGIADGFIQQHQPRSHTIVEAHPDVYRHMCAQGWDTRPGVRVVFGRWQDVIEQLGPFDGVFFDTYGEYYEDMADFHSHLPRLLRPGGVYSFFNGLAPDNMFFHLAMPMDASAPEHWEGVKSRYWHLPVYFLPTCVMGSGGAQAEQEQQQQEAGAQQGAAQEGQQGGGEREEGQQERQEQGQQALQPSPGGS